MVRVVYQEDRIIKLQSQYIEDNLEYNQGRKGLVKRLIDTFTHNQIILFDFSVDTSISCVDQALEGSVSLRITFWCSASSLVAYPLHVSDESTATFDHY